MSLVDRSFEEVCAIMDRTGDTVELLVEHAADFRMCDLLDDPAPLNPGSGGGGNLRKSTEDPTSGLAPGKSIVSPFSLVQILHLRSICFRKNKIQN